MTDIFVLFHKIIHLRCKRRLSEFCSLDEILLLRCLLRPRIFTAFSSVLRLLLARVSHRHKHMRAPLGCCVLGPTSAPKHGQTEG